MIIGVLKETAANEHRVAVVPAHLPSLTKAGASIVVQAGAGIAAGYPDQQYQDKGAEIAADAAAVAAKADVLLMVQSGAARADLVDSVKQGQVLVGMMDPYQPNDVFSSFVSKGVTTLSMELMPRITRAQSMDVLSSMANLAGYKAALLAADNLPKMFPMMMTAAGTITPAKVFVIGVGVAGLQAIATTKRLGAVVSAYDIRPAVKDQVLSLGAKFVEMELDSDTAEDSGGYAREMDEEFYRKQRELMKSVIAESDVVITTAAIPGKQSPVLVTTEMVEAMAPGSVIVDLAVERGGNVEPSKPGETVNHNGVSIIGPVNIASTLSYNASQLYSKNITTYLLSLIDKESKQLTLNMEDEIVQATVVTHQGVAPNERTREWLGLQA
ncbi:Re/Si-specific NAD(P)(+) transhydrogenase subunit alpha [Spirochaeta africana]|uniref:NAD(P) transhydrogenase subunit alpha part 1 n=1 Tax=Spirochaeta africana (strain ATCC 700263 / DSM 8902 / Z-7692) TaxID=889378 RepID=H9UMS0_SPIAZ|nr:Re/Si-specific NAD(P)(+) transhydrogenase subunit alpha [Spirochaeta africana]AFG38813.1 NAD/NADP transhydrogenase alpha subunit [Spirochaeta africana DSM 8902]